MLSLFFRKKKNQKTKKFFFKKTNKEQKKKKVQFKKKKKTCVTFYKKMQQSEAEKESDSAIGPAGDGKADDVKIVMVLDSSGSMASIRDDIIGSVNSFLDQQKKLLVNDNATFSLLQFGQVIRW